MSDRLARAAERLRAITDKVAGKPLFVPDGWDAEERAYDVERRVFETAVAAVADELGLPVGWCNLMRSIRDVGAFAGPDAADVLREIALNRFGLLIDFRLQFVSVQTVH